MATEKSPAVRKVHQSDEALRQLLELKGPTQQMRQFWGPKSRAKDAWGRPWSGFQQADLSHGGPNVPGGPARQSAAKRSRGPAESSQ